MALQASPQVPSLQYCLSSRLPPPCTQSSSTPALPSLSSLLTSPGASVQRSILQRCCGESTNLGWIEVPIHTVIRIPRGLRSACPRVLHLGRDNPQILTHPENRVPILAATCSLKSRTSGLFLGQEEFPPCCLGSRDIPRSTD